MIKKIINKIRKTSREKNSYDFFLKYLTNVSLKDKINNISRPDKPLLRILGNGNSLSSLLISEISRDCDYMVMNSHALHSSYKEIKPKYYVLADPAFFYPKATSFGMSVVQKIFEETDWEMTLFIPWEHARKAKLESTKWVTIEYVNQSEYKGPEIYREYLYEHNLAMPTVNNVLASAIYISIYLGYKNIELYGVEHSWIRDIYVNNKNQVCLKDSHFYDQEEVKENIIVDSNGIPKKFHEVLKMYMEYFPAYWELRELADKHSCRIINCTPDSFIDAFEKEERRK